MHAVCTRRREGAPAPAIGCTEERARDSPRTSSGRSSGAVQGVRPAAAIAARAPSGVRNKRWSIAANRRSRPSARLTARRYARGHGFGSPPPRSPRLRARRSRSPARSPRRSADRPRRPRRPRTARARSRAGPGRSASGSARRARARSGVARRAEDVAHRRSREELGPELLELAPRSPVGAEHAVADVGAAARQREHPRVPGQEVALEQHPQADRRRRRRSTGAPRAIRRDRAARRARARGARLTSDRRRRSRDARAAASRRARSTSTSSPCAASFSTAHCSRTSTPRRRASATSAASRSRRAITAACSPSVGSGSVTCRPLGDTSTVSRTIAAPIAANSPHDEPERLQQRGARSR